MNNGFLRIEMGKAQHGDCLLVEWSNADGAERRMLIDGGPIGAYDALASRLSALPADSRSFELMVLSHVDTDHIEGMVRLFAEPPEHWPFQVKDVWFNGWRHMDEDTLGGRQGEFFSALLQHRLPPGAWNGAFSGPVVVPSEGALPVVTLDGGLTLTILSPTREKLEKMREAWRKDLKKGGITPGDLDAAWRELATDSKYLPDDGLLASSDASIAEILQRQFKADQAAANGASIAFLAEHPSGSCLFLADAHPDAVTSSIKRLLADRGTARLAVDAVKVAHHGSKNNTDQALIDLIDSPRFLFSTSGAKFKHPDEEVIARILESASGRPVTLYFNYLSDHNRKWQDATLQKQLNFAAVFSEFEAPLVVNLA